jgi:hypothetical protein
MVERNFESTKEGGYLYLVGRTIHQKPVKKDECDSVDMNASIEPEAISEREKVERFLLLWEYLTQFIGVSSGTLGSVLSGFEEARS